MKQLADCGSKLYNFYTYRDCYDVTLEKIHSPIRSLLRNKNSDMNVTMGWHKNFEI